MEIAATVLSILVALLYLASGGTKLAGQARQVETAQQLGIAFARYRLIGIPELAASIGLVVGPVGAGDRRRGGDRPRAVDGGSDRRARSSRASGR